MTKEGMIKLAKARLEQKSQERHFSDETVLSMKREYEIKCEKYESKIKELEAQIEKMKVCCNCDWSNYLPNGNCLDCDGKKNWKLKEIKRK